MPSRRRFITTTASAGAALAVGPAATLAFAWWGSSGEFDGLVTSHFSVGSSTRVSRKNWAEPFIAG